MGRTIRYGANIPPPDATVDWSHPLAQDLLVVVAEGVVRSRTDVAAQTSRGTAHGVALDGANTHALLRNGPILGGRPQWSVTARFYRYDTVYLGINGAALYAERAPSGNDLVKLNASRSSLANAYDCIYRDDAGTLLNDMTAGNAQKAVLGPATVTFAMNVPGSWSCWEDGRFVKSGTYGGTTAFTNANIESRIGRDAQDPYSTFGNGVVELLHLHARALTASEVAWLHDEPYAMFVSERSGRVFVMGSGFRPWQVRRPKVLGGGILR